MIGALMMALQVAAAAPQGTKAPAPSRARPIVVVDAGHGARLCVGDQRVQGILPLAIQIGGSHHVVIIVAIVLRRAQGRERRLRFPGIAFGQVGIRQAYRHRAAIRAGQLCFRVVILREVKVVH